MKMNGHELWAVILEKAFAKFCGSYSHLDGGWAVWGWRVLTGDHCFRLTLDKASKKWSRTSFEAKRGADGIDGTFRGTSESYSIDEAWNLILNYIEAKGLLSASGGAQMGGGGCPCRSSSSSTSNRLTPGIAPLARHCPSPSSLSYSARRSAPASTISAIRHTSPISL